MADGKVIFEIAADPRKAEQAINDVTQELKQAGAKWEDTAERSSGNMTKSFNAAFNTERIKNWAIAGIKALGDFAKSAVNAASDLEVVQNVVDTTFGSSAGEINTWAQNAIKQFGLTETQAKRFSSTMGAMLKSSGAASDDIVQMSEDLAGLAADMASFYNLDFDTAFQKIRSGISGETEPLKQLGINMSVANLNAYALEKGLSKTFDKMTQGEQVMLRYQYIMNATADAQGDFARTSDGFANSQRLLASNIDSLKTKFGELLVGPLADLTTWANDTLSKFTTPSTTTVLDTFNGIQIDTEKKLAEIDKIADEANDLIDVLNDISGAKVDDTTFKASASVIADSISGMASAANSLKGNAQSHWEGVLTAISRKTGTDFTSKTGNARDKIAALATALSGNSLDQSRAAAFQELIGSLKDNAGALAQMAGKDETDLVTWLDNLANAANGLDPAKADGWDKLLSSLASGLMGDLSTEEGKAFFSALTEYFLSMGSGSEEAKQGLLALGYTEEEITRAQEDWLETVKRLQSTIPGLADIVNTETGAVEGGADALRDYVAEWRKEQEALVLWSAHYAKQRALAEAEGSLAGYRITAGGAKKAVERIEKEIKDLVGDDAAKLILDPTYYQLVGGRDNLFKQLGVDADTLKEKLDELETAKETARTADAEYQAQVEANKEATQQLADEYDYLVDEVGDYEDKAKAAANANGELADSADEVSEATKKQLDAVKEALWAVEEYAEEARKATEKQVEGVLDTFKMIETPADKVRKEVKSLQKQIEEADLDKKGELTLQMTMKAGEMPTITNMAAGLQSQLDYMREYQRLLQEARSRGVSEDILSMLSDGSEQSFDYLRALSENGGSIEELNKVYAEVQAEAKNFTDTLTEQKLSTDEAFKSIVQTANDALAELNKGDEAKTAATNVMHGLIDGLSELEPDLKNTVDEIMRTMGRLYTFGGFSFTGLTGVTYTPPHSHANGLEYVPFDGYFATLHEGESILNEQEARVWRGIQSTYGGVDYDALGGVMRDNIRPGGNVYLDGRTVGRVISEQQGNSYRSLERSGWQK